MLSKSFYESEKRAGKTERNREREREKREKQLEPN